MAQGANPHWGEPNRFHRTLSGTASEVLPARAGVWKNIRAVQSGSLKGQPLGMARRIAHSPSPDSV
jgi:hypothetical protein